MDSTIEVTRDELSTGGSGDTSGGQSGKATPIGTSLKFLRTNSSDFYKPVLSSVYVNVHLKIGVAQAAFISDTPSLIEV